MDIEVALYSGRPNPRFRLESDAAAELLRRLTALPPLSGAPKTQDGLGYRGIRIETDTSEIQVSDGTVLIHERTGRERQLRDPGRPLESCLVEAAAAVLEPETAAFLRQDLRQG